MLSFVHDIFSGIVPPRATDELYETIDIQFTKDVDRALQYYLSRMQEGVDVVEGMEDVVNLASIGSRYLMDTVYWTLLPQGNIQRCETIVSISIDLILLLQW